MSSSVTNSKYKIVSGVIQVQPKHACGLFTYSLSARCFILVPFLK